MQELADAVRTEVAAAQARLEKMSEADASRDRGPGKWIRKEILGHLIDSAANNHQRFVRAQLVDPFIGPAYEQDAWVTLHGYRQRPWTELVALWTAMNRHLAHVIERMPADRLRTECRIGPNPAASLEWVMRDYLVHMKHHLAQIDEA